MLRNRLSIFGQSIPGDIITSVGSVRRLSQNTHNRASVFFRNLLWVWSLKKTWLRAVLFVGCEVRFGL